MIIFVPVLLKKILEQGRDFPWKRSPCCLKCNHYKVWSHGFVQRHFDGFDTFLLLKCYRCPNCGCILTLRPDTHFSRFQASKDTIRSSIEKRIKSGRWPWEFRGREFRGQYKYLYGVVEVVYAVP